MDHSNGIPGFIHDNIDEHPKDIVKLTMDKFSMTRQGVLRHLRKLVKEGLIQVVGTTIDREYTALPIKKELHLLDPKVDNEEDVVWREKIHPILSGLRRNVYNICQYGFTEMYNNVIDHADATSASVTVELYIKKVYMVLSDNGIGIFNNIQMKYGLKDKRHAILELSKGKLTTDPDHHSGEGIFFTSRMFDDYSILSDNLAFLALMNSNDWLLEKENATEGTLIIMEIDTESRRTMQEVFKKYSSEGSFGFDRTHIPVYLSQYGVDNLVSRSQARRLLTRLDRFKEITLDFEGVEEIGQAFADEIFRVFVKSHPNISLINIRDNEQIRGMISRVTDEQ